MQTIPARPNAKRARSKLTDDSAMLPLPAKNSRTRKTTVSSSAVEIVAIHPEPEDLTHSIATTAYFIAAERNFTPGQELDDWLQAERRIRSVQTD